jgi:hypothetical protein
MPRWLRCCVNGLVLLLWFGAGLFLLMMMVIVGEELTADGGGFFFLGVSGHVGLCGGLVCVFE